MARGESWMWMARSESWAAWTKAAGCSGGAAMSPLGKDEEGAERARGCVG